MTISLEKILFAYILENKKYFNVVLPHFFLNREIEMVYGIIRKYMLDDMSAKLPSPKQIFEMVALDDIDGIITKPILKSMLTVDLTQYDEKKFIQPNMNSWILANRIKNGAVDIVDRIRNIDSLNDFESVMITANNIKSITDDMCSTKFVHDDNMGADFDDVDSHIQDNSKYKVRSGFETLDHMLGGGWDVSTLTVIMAQTSAGKCFLGNIKVRNKDTGVIEDIPVDQFFERLKNELHTN